MTRGLLLSRVLAARHFLPSESRILVSALFVVLGVWVFALVSGIALSGRSQAFDEAILLGLRRADDLTRPIGPSWCLPFALELTALGGGIVLITVILMIAGFLALERRYGMVAFTLGVTLSGMLLSALLKGVFDRGRPSVVPHLVAVTSPSFPSGHAMISAVVYLTLGALLARSTSDWRLRAYFVGVAMSLTLLIGLTRVYLGVHYPTDVLAGWSAGVTWALGCDLAASGLQRRGTLRRSSERSRPRPSP